MLELLLATPGRELALNKFCAKAVRLNESNSADNWPQFTSNYIVGIFYSRGGCVVTIKEARWRE
ncbi:hypothetical protein [Paraburkholderia sp. J63]|uniref:hypothetical protein n=1 Tax=Paraburkholderia sp. J63 TaxID=2805434 RepID=UPI002ABD2434|nr:hypothetical protein [Paraburkholderia sp. J63]